MGGGRLLERQLVCRHQWLGGRSRVQSQLGQGPVATCACLGGHGGREEAHRRSTPLTVHGRGESGPHGRSATRAPMPRPSSEQTLRSEDRRAIKMFDTMAPRSDYPCARHCGAAHTASYISPQSNHAHQPTHGNDDDQHRSALHRNISRSRSRLHCTSPLPGPPRPCIATSRSSISDYSRLTVERRPARMGYAVYS